MLHLLDLPICFVGLDSGGVELLPQLVDLLENGGEIGRRRHRSCFDLEPGEMVVDWIQDWITEVEVDLGYGYQLTRITVLSHGFHSECSLGIHHMRTRRSFSSKSSPPPSRQVEFLEQELGAAKADKFQIKLLSTARKRLYGLQAGPQPLSRPLHGP